jgi:hypothetical protein
MSRPRSRRGETYAERIAHVAGRVGGRWSNVYCRAAECFLSDAHRDGAIGGGELLDLRVQYAQRAYQMDTHPDSDAVGAAR